MTKADEQLVDSLRHAAKRPESWDVPGLLQDAADRIKILADELNRRQQGANRREGR